MKSQNNITPLMEQYIEIKRDYSDVLLFFRMGDFYELFFDDAYLASGFSTFTLEDNIRYLKEFKLDDRVYPSFHLANVNKKLLHFVGILQNESGELSAIFETVLAHMDLNARKVTEFSDQKLKKLLEYSSSNKLIEDLPFDLKLKIRDLDA